MAQLAVFGFGSVGRVLARQTLDIGQKVVAVADSSGVLISLQGFSHGDIASLGETKRNGGSLSQAKVSCDAKLIPNPAEAIAFLHSKNALDCVTDCSAFADPKQYLFPSLELSIPIALANKKPFTGSYADYLTLTKNRKLVGMESTCGAGLPVIVTLQRMLDSGDKITRIEGQLSGTLGYILSALETGGKFSDIVREAKSLGYTEPDPRDDLSGTDVARKSLILARMISQKIELSDISVEALYPAEFGKLSLDEFMARLPELDDSMSKKVAEAKAKKQVLRYAAVVEPNKKTSVGLVSVDATNPLASLKGTDNLVSFASKFYNTSPTVVRGPGAGLEVTAAGVLADAMHLVSYRNK